MLHSPFAQGAAMGLSFCAFFAAAVLFAIWTDTGVFGYGLFVMGCVAIAAVIAEVRARKKMGAHRDR